MSIIEKAVARLDARTATGNVVTAVPTAPAEGAAQPAHKETPVSSTVTQEVSHGVIPEVVSPPALASMPVNAETDPPFVISVNAKRRIIDLDRLQSMGMLVPGMDRSSIAEDFRGIKRPLLTQAFTRNAEKSRHSNLIMITSALPGEGKSFCAINLAMSIAMEMDRTVLLIDADVARPTIPRYLGLPMEKGLMDVLSDPAMELSEVLLRTNVDSLSILQAGKKHRNATEMLASQAMMRLLDDISNRYPDRIIIFDSPPLLLTSESHVLAQQMGQIALVVEAEVTTQHAVKNALAQLEGCANVGLIYNKSRIFLGEGTYGNYYN